MVPRDCREPNIPGLDVFEGGMLGSPLPEIAGRKDVSPTLVDGMTEVRHPPRPVGRGHRFMQMDGEGMLILVVDAEVKFTQLHDAARSKYSTDVFDEELVVFNLLRVPYEWTWSSSGEG